MRGLLLTQAVAMGLSAWLLAPASAAQETNNHTASHRERIALPPDAVFAAILGDVSRAEPPDMRLLINGMFVYLADAPRLTECRTGRSYPVAMAGDYLRLERAYGAAREVPAQLLMVTFAGGIEQRPRADGEGTEATVIVERFINVWPGETCERNRADAALINTYWRIVRLGDEDIRAVDGRREPHVVLRIQDARFSATVGCNQMAGGYEASGETLRFSQVASTMMACPPPLDQRERRLAEALANTRSWHIAGQVLELRDGEGRPVALCQAVYLH